MDVKVGLGRRRVPWRQRQRECGIDGGIFVFLLSGTAREKMKLPTRSGANLEKALENSLSDLPTTTLTLTAETLPDVRAGSVVPYRKFEVGEVITVRPRANTLTSTRILPEYRHPLTSTVCSGGRRREGAT